MIRRPPLRAAVTTLAAAAILVGGADLASYAATGHPLVLGHSNSAVGTTSLKNLGRGPALSLNSAKSSPPFTVNSSKLVKHLNANLVGGKTAAQLVPKTLRFRLGSTAETFAADSTHFFSAKVPKGTYDVGVTGVVTDAPSGGTDTYACLIGDEATLVGILGGTSSDLSRIYALDGDQQGSFTFGLVDATNHAQKVSGSVAYGCIFTGTGTFTVQRPITFTMRPVTASDKSGQPLPIAKDGARRLARALR